MEEEKERMKRRTLRRVDRGPKGSCLPPPCKPKRERRKGREREKGEKGKEKKRER